MGVCKTTGLQGRAVPYLWGVQALCKVCSLKAYNERAVTVLLNLLTIKVTLSLISQRSETYLVKPGPPCCLCTHLEVRKPWESQQCRSAFTLKQVDEERQKSQQQPLLKVLSQKVLSQLRLDGILKFMQFQSPSDAEDADVPPIRAQDDLGTYLHWAEKRFFSVQMTSDPSNGLLKGEKEREIEEKHSDSFYNSAAIITSFSFCILLDN